MQLHNTTGVAKGTLGPWSPKYIISIIRLSFWQCYRNVVLRLNEHGDVIETQTIILYLCDMHNNMHIAQSLSPPKFSSKLGPWFENNVQHGVSKISSFWRKGCFFNLQPELSIFELYHWSKPFNDVYSKDR